MCGCLSLLIGMATPRFALVLIAIFTDRISDAFDGNNFLAFSGWLFLPMTELAYVLITWWSGGVAGFGWFLVALGFLVDAGTYAGGWQRRNRLSLRA